MTQAKPEERVIEIDKRMAELEAEVSRLSTQSGDVPASSEEPWLKKIVGIYKDDPLFDEAERLGREYRQNEGAQPDKNAT